MSRKTFLGLLANPINYHACLRKIAGSIEAAILWQQLEYWFNVMSEKGENTFYKSLTTQEYGGSGWTEELGFSEEEVRTAFSKIGTAYRSKSLFKSEADPFKGKMYCSYTDRISLKTYYYRNEEEVEKCLALVLEAKQLSSVNRPSQFTVNQSSQFTETDQASLRKPTKPVSIIYTENNTENNTDILSASQQDNVNQVCQESITVSSVEGSSPVLPSPPTPAPDLTKNNNAAKLISLSAIDTKPAKDPKEKALSTEGVEIFKVFKRCIFSGCTERTPTIVSGIADLINIFKEYFPKDYAAKACQALEKHGQSDWHKQKRLENPVLVSPKIVLSRSFIENSLLPLVFNQTPDGKLSRRTFTEDELREISEANKRVIADSMVKRN